MAIVWEKDVEKCDGLGGFDKGRKGRRFWRKGLGYYVLLFLVIWTVHKSILSRGGDDEKPAAELPCPRWSNSIPSFVFDYAPLLWLDEDEEFFPASLEVHVKHTIPSINYEPIKFDNISEHINLYNLDILNYFGFRGLDVYLTAKDNISSLPSWIHGTRPNTLGYTNVTNAAIIVVPRDEVTTDVFYTYFYSYNRGAVVWGHLLGDHVGDWEHNMIRFIDGQPQSMWFSQHGGGQAFSYDVVEKIGLRPVSYSARGTHANYAVAGVQERLFPGTPIGLLLTDYTSQGNLWDPIMNAYWYSYNTTSREFIGAEGEDDVRNPLGAMNFHGRWGDQQYPDGDKRQESWWGWKRFVDGPTGPWDKDLIRSNVCRPNTLGRCSVKNTLTGWSEEEDGVHIDDHEGEETQEVTLILSG